MNKSIKYYQQLSGLAFALFLTLVSLQIVWVFKAVDFREREIIHELKEVVGEVAMEINGIDHSAFHGTLDDFPLVPMAVMEEKVDNYLKSKGINKETYFAIFQDSIGGLFRGNDISLKKELIDSEVRACLSCISSFSTVAKKDSAKLNPETLSSDSLQILATFQFYSPIKGLKKDIGETLWVSLYQPNTFSEALRSLIYLFAINIVLLLLLLGLFYILLKSLAAHKELTQVKDDFFNNVTHEFKTPLSSIRLASKVLSENPDPIKAKTYHHLIEKESKSLEHQIDKLLELSLLDNNKLTLEKEPVNICQLLNEIPIKLKPLLENQSGQLDINCDLKNNTITGDKYHLLSSFCNLVENSLKYSSSDVTIKINAFYKKEQLIISVKDNGPGINKEYQSKIFSRFFRGQKNDNYKGTGFGIGLSYVKNIIEAHGGTIELNTSHKPGTEFIIKLN
ncbi:MAG: sensor histidine kinase [Saprospiraceae bacterium]